MLRSTVKSINRPKKRYKKGGSGSPWWLGGSSWCHCFSLRGCCRPIVPHTYTWTSSPSALAARWSLCGGLLIGLKRRWKREINVFYKYKSTVSRLWNLSAPLSFYKCVNTETALSSIISTHCDEMFARETSEVNISTDSYINDHLRDAASYLGWVGSCPIRTRLWKKRRKQNSTSCLFKSNSTSSSTVMTHSGTQSRWQNPKAASAHICGLVKSLSFVVCSGWKCSEQDSVQGETRMLRHKSFLAKYNYLR